MNCHGEIQLWIPKRRTFLSRQHIAGREQSCPVLLCFNESELISRKLRKLLLCHVLLQIFSLVSLKISFFSHSSFGMMRNCNNTSNSIKLQCPSSPIPNHKEPELGFSKPILDSIIMVGIEKKNKRDFCDQFNSASKKIKSLTELILNIFSLSGGSQQWEKGTFGSSGGKFTQMVWENWHCAWRCGGLEKKLP